MYIYDTLKNPIPSSSHTTPTYRSDPAAHRRPAAWSWISERETRSDHSSTHDPHRISLMDCPRRPGCHQSPATKHRASPDHGSTGGSEKTTTPTEEKGEPRTAPPGIETVKSRVCPRTSATGYPFIDGHQRPGCSQSPATR